MRHASLVAFLCLVPLSESGAQNGAIAPDAILPPVIPWDGASREFVVSPDHPWITPCENSGLTRSPSYDDTVAWLRRLVEGSPELHMLSLGKSPEQRDIWMIVASAAHEFTPEAIRRSARPTLLAQAGIHAGEIDGKDAGMMFLRDLTVQGTQRHLLDGANFLFVPVFNVDGHERASAFGRVNQRGPEVMGWRTTSRNLNLNRDYTKLDCPEMQAMIRALNEWQPHLYLDLHVTDGADYQYDITFGFNSPRCHSPGGSGWMASVLAPALIRDLRQWGHIPGPLVFPMDGSDLGRGLVNWTADPRFSNGYGDLRHLPTLLVENHSLKPFDQRVLGTYVLLASALETLAAHHEALREAVAADRLRRANPVPLSWGPSQDEPQTIEFLGIESRTESSEILGGPVTRWTGKPSNIEIPYVEFVEPRTSVERPLSYWIPPAWSEVIERLTMHGVQLERITAPRRIQAEVYRLEEATLGSNAFEGHVRVRSKVVSEVREVLLSAGSVQVSTDQPLGDLAVLLLEPASPDSFFQWGFFLEILQRTEYIEAYAVEPLGRLLLERDPELSREYQEKLAAEEEFRDSPRARMRWLYRHSPYYDERHLVYPVVREVSSPR